MTAFGAANWHRTKLLIFDVDGTLYRQGRLRATMALEMLVDAARQRDLTPARTVARYRQRRERLADAEIHDFDAALIAELVHATGMRESEIDSIVSEWIERRPLRHLLAARLAGVEAVFQGARRSGKRIAVLSDYPAVDKLAALGLQADLVIAAADPAVSVMKPSPAGILRILDLAGVDASDAVMIGDRVERDGMAAQRAGVHALIRSKKRLPGWQTFASYGDAVFAPLLTQA